LKEPSGLVLKPWERLIEKGAALASRRLQSSVAADSLFLMDPQSDRTLVHLWRGGDQDAAQKLFERYVDRLVGVAKRRISERLASRIDAEDVVQSVFRTFFVRAREGQFQITDPDDLCRLLARMTVHKTLRKVEHHTAAKRDAGAEERQGADAQQRLAEFLDREPSPEAASMFLDQLEHFLAQLKPEEQQILEMRMQGHSTEEIAEKLCTYDRKVRRVMERIRGLAEQEELGG
jgi:RNA polymerase sigma-70 factor, ECF subfamily